MKIIILLFAFTFGIGAAGKNTCKEIKRVSERRVMNSLSDYPNLLPIIEITASRT